MVSVRYFGGLWMSFSEELQGQISACLQKTYICIIYTSHRMIQLSVSVVNDKPVCGFSFVFGKNSVIRKEYLGTGY